jgi:hypothetical protein
LLLVSIVIFSVIFTVKLFFDALLYRLAHPSLEVMVFG